MNTIAGEAPGDLLVISRLLRPTQLAPALVRRLPAVALDWDERQKSRFEARDSSGRRLGVFLPRGTVVRGGDVMVAEDGTMARVDALPQRLMRVQPCAVHGRPGDLVRAAYHLGNRHVTLELGSGFLQFEPDPVLADMLRALGLDVLELDAAFEPEAGAYAHGAHQSGHRHGHDPAHEQGHDHDHDHGHCTHLHHAHGSSPGDASD